MVVDRQLETEPSPVTECMEKKRLGKEPATHEYVIGGERCVFCNELAPTLSEMFAWRERVRKHTLYYLRHTQPWMEE